MGIKSQNWPSSLSRKCSQQWEWDINPIRCAWEMDVQNLWGWSINDWSKLRPKPCEGPMTNTTWMSRNQKLSSSETPQKSQWNDSQPYCYTHWLVPSLLVIRDATSSNWWEEMERPPYQIVGRARVIPQKKDSKDCRNQRGWGHQKNMSHRAN